MLTTNELELLERLCGDPLLLDHEAAFGVTLADPPDEPEPAGVGAAPACAGAADPFALLLAALRLPDGDTGLELLGG
jgi:hypothetical protein